MISAVPVIGIFTSKGRSLVKGEGELTRRNTMRNTNRLCRQWLLEHNYDYVWLKPHMDTRRSRKDVYYTKEGVFFQTDIYNLFDGICYDPQGNLVYLQLSTTKYHSEEPYRKFFSNKIGKCLMMRAVKKKNRWLIQTKEIKDHDHTISVQNQV